MRLVTSRREGAGRYDSFVGAGVELGASRAGNTRVVGGRIAAGDAGGNEVRTRDRARQQVEVVDRVGGVHPLVACQHGVLPAGHAA